jgi:hypothetical protein
MFGSMTSRPPLRNPRPTYRLTLKGEPAHASDGRRRVEGIAFADGRKNRAECFRGGILQRVDGRGQALGRGRDRRLGRK